MHSLDRTMSSPDRALPSSREVDLSVIIVTWNVRALVLQCLASIRPALDRLALEVELIDNASSDGTVEAVKQSFPWVDVLANDDNIGFARGNNQGMRRANGRYVLLLNPDTEVHPGALEALVRFMDEHASAGGCGPRLLNPDGSLQTSSYPFPTPMREFWRLFHLDALQALGVYRMADWDVQTARTVDVVQGACLLLRSEALDEIGVLDEGYFMYTEEVDLCYRLVQSGWELWWVPQAEVVHHGGQSTRQVQADMFLHLYRSKIQFFRKQYGPLAVHVYKLILLAATLLRLTLSPVAWLAGGRTRERGLQLAGNYYRLLLALPGL